MFCVDFLAFFVWICLNWSLTGCEGRRKNNKQHQNGFDIFNSLLMWGLELSMWANSFYTRFFCSQYMHRTSAIRWVLLRSFPVLHCASLLCIISLVISAGSLRNGGGFIFAAEPSRGSISPFSRKRGRWPIIFFCCFELSNKFLYVT